MRITCGLLLFALAFPVAAQRDEIARLEIAQLKEMILAIEAKNKELRVADALANEQRFKAQEQAIAFALAEKEKAIIKAELGTEKRFESVNEFRNQLKDQTGTFITRNEMWGWLVALVMMAFAAYNAFRRANTPKDV